MRIIHQLILISILLLLSQYDSKSQLSNSYMTGATKGEIDTLASEVSMGLVETTMGLQESEIDPETYILGPGDELTIMILTQTPSLFRMVVSPEGSLQIPKIGSIDVKNMTLNQLKEIVTQKAKSIFKIDEIYLNMLKLRKFKVTLAGAVLKPNIIPATPVDRVSEVIERAGGLKFNASLRKIRLYRKGNNEIINVDLLKYSRGLNKDMNPFVQGGDHVVVPEGNEKNIIAIHGDVPSPGEFEFVEGDKLSDLFKFSLGFFDSALLDSIELSRYRGEYIVERRIIDLNAWRDSFYTNLALPGDFELSPGDWIYVPRNINWNTPAKVAITGQVKYPGYYAITRNKDKLYDLIIRAGGFKDDASLESASLVRQKELKIKDDEMERLWRTPSSEMSETEFQYFQARVREKKGFMAINFAKVMSDPNVEDNVYLEDEDSVYVPPKKIFVNVQGRVNNPGLVNYNPKLTYLDYIALAGGFGYRADESETIIAKQKGELFNAESMNYNIEPGDNILVPPVSDTSTWKIISEGLTVAVQLASIVGLVVSLLAISKQN